MTVEEIEGSSNRKESTMANKDDAIHAMSRREFLKTSTFAGMGLGLGGAGLLPMPLGDVRNNELRLSFSSLPIARLQEGARRLGEAAHDFLRNEECS